MLSQTPVYSFQRSSVSHYGITWTFDREYETGQFITGDWWVKGPVTIVSVTPAPGTAPKDEHFEIKKGRYGASKYQDNKSMRNGSMLVLEATNGQGYDSRGRSYKAELSVSFPVKLLVDRSLISSISHTRIPNPHFLKTHWDSSDQILKTAAVLTCVSSPPPEDAFRPAYAGTTNTIYRAGNLKRELLPSLKPVSRMPEPSEVADYFKRPWIDHQRTWLRVTAQENSPTYGREYSRTVGFGACMLMLDIDSKIKERILIGLVQLGIDIFGVTQIGVHWNADGGHYSGRKFPIVFAGIMLSEETMQNVSKSVLFHEDQQTYYGKSFWGHEVLWQMVHHSGHRPPFEEKDPTTYDKFDKRSDGYRVCCNGHSWIGQTLAIHWFKMMAAWNHDAYFDYCDRWMDPKETIIDAKRPRKNIYSAKATDEWITRMWKEYRHKAPEQPGGTDNLKWVWEDEGKWVDNPKPKK